MGKEKVEQGSLADLIPDSNNANRGTARGRRVLEDSLRKVGAGRSVLADKNGNLIAGNKTAETWGDIADMDDVLVVHTDGKKLVVVQRDDLDFESDDPEVRKRTRMAAYFDNRAGEVSLAWDAAATIADMQEGVSLDDLFTPKELETIVNAAAAKTLEFEVGGDFEPSNLDMSGFKPSTVRMVQLFFEGEDFESFNGKLARLSNEWGTEDTTQTVVEAIKRAFDSLN